MRHLPARPKPRAWVGLHPHGWRGPKHLSYHLLLFQDLLAGSWIKGRVSGALTDHLLWGVDAPGVLFADCAPMPGTTLHFTLHHLCFKGPFVYNAVTKLS